MVWLLVLLLWQMALPFSRVACSRYLLSPVHHNSQLLAYWVLVALHLVELRPLPYSEFVMVYMA
jgi:hypothetical protein